METPDYVSGFNKGSADSVIKLKQSETNQDKKMLRKNVAISVSESEELEQLGLSLHHLQDISIEIARYLIVNGAKLLYGGDLRNGGFTELFSELSYQYKYLFDKESRFINYFPFPTASNLTVQDKAVFMLKQVELRLLDAPMTLKKLSSPTDMSPSDKGKDKLFFAECLTHMRKQMSTDCHARIVLGGKQDGYMGYYPGIVEESYYTIMDDKAIYLLGGFGGATKAIIETISGRSPEKNNINFQIDLELLKQNTINGENNLLGYSDPNFLSNFFRNYSIAKIAENNGLTIDENFVLFESTNIHELIYLIIKGLSHIKCR
jgi:hypothetical protein